MLLNPTIYGAASPGPIASIDFIRKGQYPAYSSSVFYSTALWCESYIFGTAGSEISPITSLNTIDLPECLYIGYAAFAAPYVSVPLSISLPKCEYIDTNAFSYCQVTSLCAPAVTFVQSEAFAGCIMSSIELPACSYISSAAFASSPNLRYVSLAECKYVGNIAFTACQNIEVHLPKCERIMNQAFQAANLSLYMESITSVPTLATSTGTFYSSTVKIYVPSSLYSAFMTAYGWSVVSSRIYSLP